MQHISLETAKKLHELGWTRETYFMWHIMHPFQDLDCAVPTILPRAVAPGCFRVFDIRFAAPLAEELLEVLPKIITISEREYDLHIQTDSCSFYPRYMCREELDPMCSFIYGTCHNSSAEALALLLVELVEQGVVSKDALTNGE